MPTINYKMKDGSRVSGVTTIIGGNLGWNKQQLMFWANKMGQEGRSHRDVAGDAADAGTAGHYLIDCDIKGIAPDTSKFQKEILDKAETAYLNFLDWKATVAFRPIATEIHLVSEKYRYGATPDCIAEIKGKPALFDWKTGNGVYEDHLIQLAAYRQAWEECNPEVPLSGGFHLLRIDKNTGAWDYHYRHALPEAWEVFTHLLALHKLHKQLKNGGGKNV